MLFSMLSCSDDTLETSPLANEIEASSTLRTVFENLRTFAAPLGKTHTGGKSGQVSDLCFQFVYPLVLEYNDNSQVTVNSFEELLKVILSESVSYHVVGLGFPFEVICHLDNTIYTIDNEEEFARLIANCNYDTLTPQDALQALSNCFTPVYPLSLKINATSTSFNDEQEMINYFTDNYNNIESFAFQYPFTVHITADDTFLDIKDEYEVINLITNTCSVY